MELQSVIGSFGNRFLISWKYLLRWRIAARSTSRAFWNQERLRKRQRSCGAVTGAPGATSAPCSFSLPHVRQAGLKRRFASPARSGGSPGNFWSTGAAGILPLQREHGAALPAALSSGCIDATLSAPPRLPATSPHFHTQLRGCSQHSPSLGISGRSWESDLRDFQCSSALVQGEHLRFAGLAAERGSNHAGFACCPAPTPGAASGTTASISSHSRKQ